MSKHPFVYASSISIVLFGNAIFAIGLFGGLWFFGLALDLALLIITAGFIFKMLSLAVKKRKIIYLQAASIVIASGLIASIYIDFLSADARFFIFRPYYEIQLARVQAGQNVAEIQKEGQLVAFPLVRATPDAWVSFIYDPTESLSLPKSKDIFKGTAYEIRQLKLDRRWFICYFW